MAFRWYWTPIYTFKINDLTPKHCQVLNYQFIENVCTSSSTNTPYNKPPALLNIVAISLHQQSLLLPPPIPHTINPVPSSTLLPSHFINKACYYLRHELHPLDFIKKTCYYLFFLGKKIRSIILKAYNFFTTSKLLQVFPQLLQLQKILQEVLSPTDH